MSNEELSPELQSSADTPYAVQFRRHLAEVKAHLSGKLDNALPPSYVPPNGYWTPPEKDSFFRGLRVYSRLRPDLIAACIGSKTILDVCTYIDTLDANLRGRHPLPRAAVEGAMEVSDAWVRWEEGAAEALVALETKWEAELSQQHEDEISSKWTLTEVEAGTERASAPSEDLNLQTRECDERRRWNQERALKQLGPEHLRVLEWILNEAETGIVDSDIPQYPEEQLHDSQARLLQAYSEDDLTIGDCLPDPPALRRSGVPEQGPPQSRTVPSQTHAGSPPCSGIVQHILPDEKSPTSPRPCSQIPEGIQEIPSSLSPASRRRLKKRLYMRRKRASGSGKTVVVGTTKLRPGRKAKETNSTKELGASPIEHEGSMDGGLDLDDVSESALRSSPSCDQPQQDDQCQERKKNAKHSKGGLTKIYKIKREFTSKAIDASILVDGDLGLFHLSALSRFMMIYKSGYDTATTKTASSISADSIRLMAAIIVEFTTEVVQRTITSREQERGMKGGIKVYGLNPDEIAAENVNHVLKIMGMKGLTRAQYFAQLLGEDIIDEIITDDGSDERDSVDYDTETDGDDEDSLSDDDGDVSHEEKPAYSSVLLPLHRELNPPLINLPKSLTPCLPSDETELALMPEDIDEVKMDQELREEMELDEADGILACKYEAELWKQREHVW